MQENREAITASCQNLDPLASIRARREHRRAPPSAFGLDVTVAIAAITEPDEVIVCVTDRMITHYDQTTASEDAADKAFQLHKRNWLVAFAAHDISPIWPIIKAVRPRLAEKDEWDLPEVKDIMSTAYSDHFQKAFASRELVRFGYKTVHEFRDSGRNELGPEVSEEISRELRKFDLGVEFLVYGYDSHRRAHVFEVSNPGRITDQSLLKYAVVGSGYHMAVASLRRKPFKRGLVPTIYRLLEAKFAAETASGVGKTTNLQLLHKQRDITFVPQAAIQQIKQIWEAQMAMPDPKEATDLIAKWSGVSD